MYTTTYRFKCYVQNDSHERKLRSLTSLCNFVYNHSVALIRRHYSLYGRTVPENDLKRHFSKLKHGCHKELHNMSVETMQCIIERIYIGYGRFFKRCAKRPPQLKKDSQRNTVTFKRLGWKLDGNTFTINKQNLKIRFFKSRGIDGDIRMVTLKRDSTGDWWLTFVAKRERTASDRFATSGKAAGIDFGLKHFLTLDDGSVIDSPEPLKNSLKQLRSESRSLSKKQKGSGNRRRARLALARHYRHIANQREDFHWKTACRLVNDFDTICAENLNLRWMEKQWGRKVHDLGFEDFMQKLSWLCDKHSKKTVRIDRFEPTSKTCSLCGHREDSMPLKVRRWICPECGAHLDRDVNAARNILRAGVSAPAGGGVRLATASIRR